MPRLPLCALVMSVVLIPLLSGTSGQVDDSRMCGRLLVRRFQRLCLDLRRRRGGPGPEQPALARPVPERRGGPSDEKHDHAAWSQQEMALNPDASRRLPMTKRDPEIDILDVFGSCCERGCSTEELVVYCGLWTASL